MYLLHFATVLVFVFFSYSSFFEIKIYHIYIEYFSAVVAPIRLLGPIDCENTSNLPIVRFVINGQQFELGPDQYILKDGGYSCSLAFMPLDLAGLKFIILGDAFLRFVHHVFEFFFYCSFRVFLRVFLLFSVLSLDLSFSSHTFISTLETLA